MDYYRNFDQLECRQENNRVSGLQISFINEDIYVEPYNISDFKAFARIDTDTDDNLLNIFLKSARVTVEQYLQKSLGIRTVRLTALNLPRNYRLPFGPVGSVTTNGFTNVGDILKEGGQDITVEYVTNDSFVNDVIIHAIYRQAYNSYENRDKYLEGNRELGMVVDEVKSMLQPYRKIVFP